MWITHTSANKMWKPGHPRPSFLLHSEEKTDFFRTADLVQNGIDGNYFMIRMSLRAKTIWKCLFSSESVMWITQTSANIMWNPNLVILGPRPSFLLQSEEKHIFSERLILFKMALMVIILWSDCRQEQKLSKNVYFRQNLSCE